MPTVVLPEASRWDDPTPLRVTGLDPGQTVTLQSSATAWFDGTGTTTATFTADAEGVVDTSDQAPLVGDYEGVAPTGWLWALSETDGPGGGQPTGDASDPTVESVVEADGEQLATAETTRRRATEGVSHEWVETPAFAGVLFTPPENGPHPGVVALHGSAGRPLRGVGAALASRGYATLAVQYFGEPDPVPDALAAVPVETVDAAATHLRERPNTTEQIAVFGRSKGAELALVTAARCSWPAAVVAVAPTQYRWQALDGGEEPRSSWTLDGDPLPFVPFRAAPGECDGATVFRETYVGSRDRVAPDRLDAARIDADSVDAPALLVAGGDDQMWPSGTDTAALTNRLRTVETRQYPDAGHGISLPHAPTTTTTAAGGLALGGTPAANARASADHWPAVLDHLAAMCQ